jgi:hypothetical protein
MKNAIVTTFGVLVFTTSLFAQSAPFPSNVFSWNGEFVALDANARVITIKSPVVGEQTAGELGRLKTGEQVVLTWSGYDTSADAIRDIRSAAGVKSTGRFMFPAEFVAFDGSRRYVTFKVQIPENSIGSLRSLKPGEWVTATSPHGSSGKSNSVLMVRPYVEGVSSINSN